MGDRGRPKKEIDLEAIRELASENNSVSDICRAVGISRSYYYQSKAAQEAFEDGRADMRINLNHWQWTNAKNNPQMQIHLGKQVLGQNDRGTEDNTSDNTLNAIIEAVKRIE